MDGQQAHIAMDPELLASVASGDRDAFATLYRRHAASSFGLALRLLGGEQRRPHRSHRHLTTRETVMRRTPLIPLALVTAIAVAGSIAAVASPPSRPQIEIENALVSLGEAVGDRVLAINGQAQSGGSEAAGRLAKAIGARDGQLAVDIERREQRLALQGEASSVTVPGYSIRVEPSGAPGSTCGIVTLISIDRPREQLFRVALVGLNDRANFDAERRVFALEPGRHTLGVDELIPSDRFSGSEHFDRQRLRQRSRTDQRIVIDVQAGVSYQIAARLLPREERDIGSGRYWEPVIARQRAEACRGGGIAAPVPAR